MVARYGALVDRCSGFAEFSARAIADACRQYMVTMRRKTNPNPVNAKPAREPPSAVAGWPDARHARAARRAREAQARDADAELPT
jgi:hypothetical protein